MKGEGTGSKEVVASDGSAGGNEKEDAEVESELENRVDDAVSWWGMVR
jgi:hypothetical protein